jgi:phosphatidylserine decarboxylase
MVRTGFYFSSAPTLAGMLLAWRGWWLAALGLWLLGGFVLFFFRDPERVAPATAGAILSPADGRVLDVDQTSWQGTPQTRVSIFLSLFDVHVNRAPIAGTITRAEYRPGRFHLASRRRASQENERNEIVVEGEGTRVVFRQIAGLLARRIEFWRKPGDQLARGERVGMIRFGSRVEVFFDPQCRLQVRRGAQVRAGTTILAIRG